jgi:hypothetical protein
LKKYLLLALVVLNLLMSSVINAEEIIYKGQSRSLIDWPNLDPYEWLDFNYWKREQLYRKKFPDWANAQRHKNNLEEVGRIIKCVGTCINERHDGAFKTGFFSKIYETNELITEKDSYVWVFLMDGTIVRMSPNSSLTFNEFNVGNKDFFVYARVNYGNVLWLSREASELEVRNLRETDSLFSLLLVSEVDEWLHRGKELDENNLFESLTRGQDSNQYEYLNRLIKENNEWINKPTRLLLSMPNGFIIGQNLSLELIVLTGNKTFFKQRSFEVYNGATTSAPEGQFIKLGFDQVEPMIISPGNWYEVDFRGRNVEQYDGELLSMFQIGELVTKRIPTVMTARELWLQKFARVLHGNEIDEKYLREEMGYRLWRDMSDEKGDLFLRYNYLLEFVRKVETQTIGAYATYIEESAKEGFAYEPTEYDSQYYTKAMADYSIRGESNYWDMAKNDRKILNSTRRKFWRIIHESGR